MYGFFFFFYLFITIRKKHISYMDNLNYKLIFGSSFHILFEEFKNNLLEYFLNFRVHK